MKIRYIVIDDSQRDTGRMIREADKTKEMVFCGSFLSAYEALASLRGKKEIIHVIFCDILLYEEDGLAAGPELATYCKYLVFVTGLSGQQGKVLDAMGDDHLAKPVTCDQIRTRVLNRFFKRHGDEIPMYIHLNKVYVYNPANKGYDKIRLKDICCITHSMNYLDISTKEGKTYTVRATIGHALSLVDPAGIFVQVNPGTILNMKYVDKWYATEAYVNEQCFELKGKGKKAFFDYVNRHQLGNGGSLD